MTWFVASIVSAIRLTEGEQSSFPVYEDFYLIEAGDQEELDLKIGEILKTIDAAGGCTLDGKAATQKCVGIRKIRSIYNSLSNDVDRHPPRDGSELTHSFYLAKSFDDVEAFSRGEAISLLCVDDADLDE